ncbi:hypothetical protein M4D52_13915 [Paenibacillus lactis]|uniref:hypothetical protein n=1 Tax=Paenibacillus lactis TaxID=228574 RepID=UPI00203DB8A1|nr:hypothetical protein [Paenibacillus lactis]MCM3494533.1 hypothetical protein [Paenibacillus lactis]
MPVQITINGENAAQAIEEFATLSAAFGGSAAPAPATQEVTKQRTTRKSSEVKKEQPKEEPEKDPSQNVADPDDFDGEDIEIPSVVDLRAKAQEVGKDPKKKPAIKKLLEEFDCKAVSDVPEEKRIAFMAALEEL